MDPIEQNIFGLGTEAWSPAGTPRVDVLVLYRFAKEHGFEATVDDDESISVHIPWSMRLDEDTMVTGIEEVSGIDSMERLRDVLGY